MKNIIFYIFSFLLILPSKVLASGDPGILGGIGANATEKIRRGEIHTDDIPNIITHAIDFLMGFAGTIAVIFVIVGAYQLAFGSISQDKTKGKETIIMALSGFALAALSWVIIRLIIDNFTG